MSLWRAPVVALNLVWTVADTLNALMALPNLIALLLLSGVVARETKSYFKRFPTMKSGELLPPEGAEIPPAEQAGALYGKENEGTSPQNEDDPPIEKRGD